MILCGASLLLSRGTAAGPALRVVGTDLLGLEASQAIYAFSGRAGFPLALALDGSGPGLDQLKSGRAGLALLVFPPGEDAAVADCESVTLAYHCLVVLAPAAVPLEQITLDQLRDIFGESGSGNVSRWGDLGLGEPVGAGAIAAQAPAVGQGITADFFRRVVLQDRAFKSTVARYATPAELALRFAGDSRALALAAARPPGASGVRIVRVAAHTGEPAYSPTPENLSSGDYPLCLPLHVVFRRESAPALRPLLRFLFSDDFARVLGRADLIPLAASARQQRVLALEKP